MLIPPKTIEVGVKRSDVVVRAPRILYVRLRDRIKPGTRVLFVGINPGIRSAQTGHHFAGYSNRFWKLLFESRLVPEPIDWQSDSRLPEWGSASPISWHARRQASIRSPSTSVWPESKCSAGKSAATNRSLSYLWGCLWTMGVPTKPGRARGAETFEGSAVFVLPNPSGRNANFSYAEMLAAFRSSVVDWI